MAGAKSDQHHVRGEMNIAEQAATFAMFNTMTKWGSLVLASLLLFLVLWFCTGAGFGGAFISAAIVASVGVFVLRGKPETEASSAH